eukprot:TRINITY_DN4160_c0_g1_i2.p1 TRINITY_DN4160_c0_g1~~TRINITY_DN4160_c0_g1_i2.p1  ORF type:complete len:198 (-),score=52.26 TRINITY_DN4160_c0_g1_i2:628-1221(-)
MSTQIIFTEEANVSNTTTHFTPRKISQSSTSAPSTPNSEKSPSSTSLIPSQTLKKVSSFSGTLKRTPSSSSLDPNSTKSRKRSDSEGAAVQETTFDVHLKKPHRNSNPEQRKDLSLKGSRVDDLSPIKESSPAVTSKVKSPVGTTEKAHLVKQQQSFKKMSQQELEETLEEAIDEYHRVQNTIVNNVKKVLHPSNVM